MLDGSLDLKLARHTALGLGGGAAWISDGNRRVSAVAALTQDLTPHVFVGAYGRLLDYRQHGVGYFSPDRFGMGEARAVNSERDAAPSGSSCRTPAAPVSRAMPAVSSTPPSASER